MGRSLLLTAILLQVFTSSTSGDFASNCPSSCSCKWSAGKKTVDCSNSGFTTIPTSMSQEVQVLTMDGNYIKELTKDAFNAAGLVHLQKVSLKNCHIQKIHEDAFSKLKILTEVNLDGNNITKLLPKTFDGNDRLQTLVLRQNQLTSLLPYQFPPISGLKKIDLSETGLKDVNQKAFMNLGQSVEEVDLSGNYLTYLKEETFLPLTNLKYLKLAKNPWVCDCKLQSFRDYVVHRNLFNSDTTCAEPGRLADKIWTDVKSLDFACKPEIEVKEARVYSQTGSNVTLSCYITGNPVPTARWVIRGRIIQNNTAPLHSAGVLQQYILQDIALAEGGIERNFSLTITNVNSHDEGEYNCVAINQGGMAERNVTLTFSAPSGWGRSDSTELTVLIGALAGGLLFILVLIIALCCFCRNRGKDKSGHAHNGSLLSYSDSAGEKLLSHSQHGTLQRTNPLPKPPRGGEYGVLPQSDQELTEYGPASYVPGDRYDELGEGRASASNSDQTGTLSRASYHSSDPDQYPDLLDIPNRYKQASPTSVCTNTSTLPPFHPHPHHHHQQQQQQPLHPAHLISPPPPPHHLHHHHHLLTHHHHPGPAAGPSGVAAVPFGRTGTLPHNYTTGTLPHNSSAGHHHPRSISCDHTGAGGGYPANRPGYVTLPRRPRASWAGVRDTPSPGAAGGAAARDPVYDGVGPRTSADGSSKLSLNRSTDNAHPPAPRTGPALSNGRVPYNGTSLPPYTPPIGPIDELPEFNGGGGKTKSTPNMVSLSEPQKGSSSSRRSPLSTSQQTLLEENLAAYCEPWGAALPPQASNSPRNRDSIASNDSDILPERRLREGEGSRTAGAAAAAEGGTAPSEVPPVMCSTPKSSASSSSNSSSNNSCDPQQQPHNTSSQLPQLLDTIPETESPVHTSSSAGKKMPPPTLPKPKSRPAPPPKPKKSSIIENGAGGDSFQDETLDGSEV